MHINKLSAKRVHWGTKNKGQDNQWRLEKRTQTKDDYFTILHKNHKETTVFVEILPQKKKNFCIRYYSIHTNYQRHKTSNINKTQISKTVINRNLFRTKVHLHK